MDLVTKTNYDEVATHVLPSSPSGAWGVKQKSSIINSSHTASLIGVVKFSDLAQWFFPCLRRWTCMYWSWAVSLGLPTNFSDIMA